MKDNEIKETMYDVGKGKRIKQKLDLMQKV